ncbi:hypothetical protein AK830_g3520 [Neonectria ditissima]|uniref:NAD(P)-binding domain-containing protein n=1 Tax=Neonectria ditissima TaxID=78410 RepID=A0A0P7BRL6_9HYPO|nr:hypothetical protein AK830_g3520 [Neonectria ditissima]
MAPKHILVLGATGQTGLDFCSAALKEGHHLTLYVRNPTKIPTDISGNTAVTVVQGTLEDKSGLQKAVSTGATIFVSFAGPGVGSKGTPVTDAMKLIFPLLVANNFERAMVLGTCSFPAPQDKGTLKWKSLVVFVKIVGGSAFNEFNGLGSFVTSQDVSSLKWTLFRVPFLGNGPEAPVTATFTGSGIDGMFLSRKSIAAWVFKEMGSGSEWIGKAPVLSN